MSRNDRQNLLVFFGVVTLIAATAVFWLGMGELTDERIRVTLRRSADFAFVLFLIVFVARPLQQLLRRNWTARLLRNRRLVGVAFAAAMTAHLGLIIYRFTSQADLDFPPPNFFGYGAYTLFYLMLITSFDAPKKALGPRAWKFLHRLGLVWASIIFGLPRSVGDLTDPEYLVFGIPFLIAVLVRVTAWQRLRRRDS